MHGISWPVRISSPANVVMFSRQIRVRGLGASCRSSIATRSSTPSWVVFVTVVTSNRAGAAASAWPAAAVVVVVGGVGHEMVPFVFSGG